MKTNTVIIGNHHKENSIMGNTNTANVNTVLSNEGGHCIELLHHADDPTVWIVRSSKKLLGFKTKTSTVWFVTKQLALDFARKQADQHRTMHAGGK